MGKFHPRAFGGMKILFTCAFFISLFAGLLLMTTTGAEAGDLADIESDLTADNPSDPLFASLPSLSRTELSVLNSEENATLGTMAVEFTPSAYATIGARLSALRAGGASLMASTSKPGPIRLAQLDTGSVNDASPAFPDRRLDVYLNGTGSTGDYDSTLSPSALLGEPGFDFDSWGALAGLDYRLTDRLVIGAALGYGSTEADLDQNLGDFEMDGYSVLAYGGYYAENFYLDGTLSFGWNDYDTTRNLSIPAISLSAEAAADFDGRQNGFSLGAGYDHAAGSLTIGPYARLDSLRTRIDAYAEEATGSIGGASASSAALRIEDQEIISTTSALGAQASYAWSTPFGVLLPQLRFEWIHEFDNHRREVSAVFIEDAGSNTFVITTDDPDEDYFNLGAGLAAVFPHGINAFVYYETPIGLDDVDAHYVTAGVRYEF